MLTIICSQLSLTNITDTHNHGFKRTHGNPMRYADCIKHMRSPTLAKCIQGIYIFCMQHAACICGCRVNQFLVNSNHISGINKWGKKLIFSSPGYLSHLFSWLSLPFLMLASSTSQLRAHLLEMKNATSQASLQVETTSLLIASLM